MIDTQVYEDIDGWKTYRGVVTFSGNQAIRIVNEKNVEVAFINVHGQLKMYVNSFNQMSPALGNFNTRDETQLKQAVRLAYLLHQQSLSKQK